MNDKQKKYNVLVTRPKHQAETLCNMIEKQGWNAIRFPTLEIKSLNNKKIQQQLNTLKQWKWLIFISANAVNFAIKANNGKIDKFKGLSIAAVGKATEKALDRAGIPVDLLPETDFNSEGLLVTDEMNHIKGNTCLIVRGKGGREILASTLRDRGAKVEYMEVYQREMPVCSNSTICEMLTQGKLDVITMTSGEALKNLIEMIGNDLRASLSAVPLIVISNRIKTLAEKQKFKHIVVAENPGETAIIETVMMSLSHL